MNSLYLILIGICFSAGVITSVVNTNQQKNTEIQCKVKNTEVVNNAESDSDLGTAKTLPISIK